MHHLMLEARSNRSSRGPTRSDTNQSVQPQKKANSLKFWIYLEERFRVAKTQALISCAVTAQLQKSGFLMTRLI